MIVWRWRLLNLSGGVFPNCIIQKIPLRQILDSSKSDSAHINGNNRAFKDSSLEKAELLTAATVTWNHTLQLFISKSAQPWVCIAQFIISVAV